MREVRVIKVILRARRRNCRFSKFVGSFVKIVTSHFWSYILCQAMSPSILFLWNFYLWMICSCWSICKHCASMFANNNFKGFVPFLILFYAVLHSSCAVRKCFFNMVRFSYTCIHFYHIHYHWFIMKNCQRLVNCITCCCLMFLYLLLLAISTCGVNLFLSKMICVSLLVLVSYFSDSDPLISYGLLAVSRILES
jgi:hypothetical protein